MDSGLVLPPGVRDERGVDATAEHAGVGVIVNDTGLPDHLVRTVIEENASMLGVNSGSTFQNFSSNAGSLLARANFRTPGNVIEEIMLARDLAERDDDIGATIGSMLATAFGEGMQNVHSDEITVALFNKMAKHANLDMQLKELYREYLISSQINTVILFTREAFQFTPEGAEQQRTRQVIAPRIGVLPAETIRVVGNDLFGTGVLAYKPPTATQDRFLEEFFAVSTSAGRKAELRRMDPVLTTLIVEKLQIEDDMPSFADDNLDVNLGTTLYRLNPRMVHRTCMPKGAWRYPRPLLTRNFALLEAKRLLNLMDFALLQGGSNFLVVAKKGTDQRPALDPEIQNLHEVVRRASRTGVIIGDHRLSIEIITPDLSELLSSEKRRLIGRKMAMALLRVPEHASEEPGAEGARADVELLTRVITSDRQDIRRHVEGYVYEEAAARNPQQFLRGAANLWFPKIILQGTQYFTDYILKMRDRGDIPRRYAVEAGGFDYDAAVQQRKREKAAGDDRVMTPAQVPFSSPNAGPQDNGGGRPAGARTGAQPADQRRQRRVIQRNAGETVRAMYDDEHGTYRVGEQTYAILEQFPDRTIGRLTAHERRGLAGAEELSWETALREGPLTVIPVNPGDDLDNLRVVRLGEGLAMVVGDRTDDDALMARAFTFRHPEYDELAAQETALQWGFEIATPRQQGALEEETAAAAPSAQVIHVHTGGQRVRKIVKRDGNGNIVSIEEEPIEAPAGGAT